MLAIKDTEENNGCYQPESVTFRNMGQEMQSGGPFLVGLPGPRVGEWGPESTRINHSFVAQG